MSDLDSQYRCEPLQKKKITPLTRHHDGHGQSSQQKTSGKTKGIKKNMDNNLTDATPITLRMHNR